MENKELIYNKYKFILDTLYKAVDIEGSNGDAIWLCRYLTLSQIFDLISEYNVKNNINYIVEIRGNYVFWGDGETWISILNNEDIFKNEQSFPYGLELIY